MAIIQSEKLICVNAEEINFTGRDGSDIHKFKYTFLDPIGELKEYYLDTNDYVKDVVDIDGDEVKEEDFKTYRFEKKVYQGKTSKKLLPRN